MAQVTAAVARESTTQRSLVVHVFPAMIPREHVCLARNLILRNGSNLFLVPRQIYSTRKKRECANLIKFTILF